MFASGASEGILKLMRSGAPLGVSSSGFLSDQKLKIQPNLKGQTNEMKSCFGGFLLTSPSLEGDGNMIKLARNQPRKSRGLLKGFFKRSHVGSPPPPNPVSGIASLNPGFPKLKIPPERPCGLPH